MPEGRLLIPKIDQIDVEKNEVIFYFEGSPASWHVVDFEAGTRTHKMLSDLESQIFKFNMTATGYISSVKS